MPVAPPSTPLLTGGVPPVMQSTVLHDGVAAQRMCRFGEGPVGKVQVRSLGAAGGVLATLLRRAFAGADVNHPHRDGRRRWQGATGPASSASLGAHVTPHHHIAQLAGARVQGAILVRHAPLNLRRRPKKVAAAVIQGPSRAGGVALTAAASSASSVRRMARRKGGERLQGESARQVRSNALAVTPKPSVWRPANLAAQSLRIHRPPRSDAVDEPCQIVRRHRHQLCHVHGARRCRRAGAGLVGRQIHDGHRGQVGAIKHLPRGRKAGGCGTGGGGNWDCSETGAARRGTHGCSASLEAGG